MCPKIFLGWFIAPYESRGTLVHHQQMAMFWARRGAQVTPRGVHNRFWAIGGYFKFLAIDLSQFECSLPINGGSPESWFNYWCSRVSKRTSLSLRGDPPPEVITIMGGLTASESWELDSCVPEQIRGIAPQVAVRIDIISTSPSSYNMWSHQATWDIQGLP